jgi:glycosyltransferase involved in cell wall biosynthesis
MPAEFLRKILGRISKTIFIPDNKKSWSGKAYKTASKLLKEEKFDALFVSVPPFSSFVIAGKLKTKFDIPFFVDYRDAWIDNQFKFYPTPYHHYRHKKLEDKALRKVDKVIVVNRRIKESLLKHYQFLNFKDITIIPHGFDPEDLNNAAATLKENNKLIITYSGIFYEGITPRYFLQAFKNVTLENPEIAANIELHFIGLFRKENGKLVKKLRLQSFVKEFGYLNHNEAVKRIISSDILWLMLPHKASMGNVSLGKMFEYFGTRKPIIASLPDGVSKNMAEEYGAAFITKPDDIQEIKGAIIRLHDLYVRNALPVPNEDFVLRHNRILLTEQLTKEFQFFLRTD